jgi:hypothetical protein
MAIYRSCWTNRSKSGTLNIHFSGDCFADSQRFSIRCFGQARLRREYKAG